MLFLLSILVVFTALAIAATLARKRKFLSSEHNPSNNLSAENFRPLFEPTEDEVRVFARDEKLRIERAGIENERLLKEAKNAETLELTESWSKNPDRKGAIELLLRASETANAETFGNVAEKILRIWRANRVDNLTSLELADLLDSHFRILPQQERAAGAMFRLREEIETLRTRSEDVT